MVEMKGWPLRKGWKCFFCDASRFLSGSRGELGPPWLVTYSTQDQQRSHIDSASWCLAGLQSSLTPLPHKHTSDIGLYLPALLASWHRPQLQRLPLGPSNGLCKQAGWLLGQIVYFVYSGTIPSRHVSITNMAFGPHMVAAPSYQLAPLLSSSESLTPWLLKCYPYILGMQNWSLSKEII